MSENLAFVIGGLMGSLASGWVLGKLIKAYRQFFDSI